MERLSRGVLVAFEGIDGAGKTTQAERLVEVLKHVGLDAVRTKEPTNGPHGQRIREAARTHRLAADEELQLFMEDRRDHVREELGPWLSAGRVVVVDRYYFSTVAYQGARGMDPDELLRRNEQIAPRPDLLVVMDIPAVDGLARVNKRGTADAFENVKDLEAARRLFQRMEGPHVLVLDASRTREQLHAQVLRAVAPLLQGAGAAVEFLRTYAEALDVGHASGLPPADMAAELLRRVDAAG